MCNLYSMTKNRDAIKQLFRVDVDRTANQPPLPAIFPDQLAPVVRIGKDGSRVMEAPQIFSLLGGWQRNFQKRID